MTCDASKVLSSLQARAMETDDRDELAASLCQTLKEAFTRTTRVSIWWVTEEGPRPGPAEGDAASVTAAREAPGDVVAALDAARERGAGVADLAGDAPDAPRRVIVPIRAMGEVVGALDVEALDASAFGEVERCILRAVADSFGGLVASG